MRLSDSTRRRALFLGFLACLAVTSSMGFAQRPAIDQKTSAKESVVKEQGRLLDAPRGVIEVLDNGPAHGEPIILLPSLGRGAGDFNDLTRRLSAAGYRVLRPQPRGIGRSSVHTGPHTLAELADDAMIAMTLIPNRQVVVVGHAFGNRVARMMATRHPARIRGVVLLAAGGKVRMEPDIEEALVKSFDLAIAEPQRLAYVAKAFFAPGNDPAVWRDGWFTKVAEAQIEATDKTPIDAWWRTSNVQVLVMQPLQDALAPPENAEILKRDGGDRVSVVYIDGAGHALLPEQPEAVAKHLLDYLRKLRG